MSSVRWARQQGVIPVGMKRVPFETKSAHLLVGDRAPGRIVPRVEQRFHGQARPRTGATDQLHYRLEIEQGLALPVQADEREETVFDFVPFARPWRIVTH